MKLPPTLVFALISFGCSSALLARPIDYKEISLLIRSHETESEISQEVAQRKLSKPLTAQQETVLRSQGASDSLLQNLRNHDLVVSNADAAAEAESTASTKPRARESSNAMRDNLEIFDVSLGHPINLSQWGGPDSEIQFNCRRFAGEDIVEAFASSPGSDFVHTAIYLGGGRAEDSTTIFDDRNYVSVMAHHFGSRSLDIDWKHPVSFENVPYLLYPLCATRGVSLYYIGTTGGSVRLAAILISLQRLEF